MEITISKEKYDALENALYKHCIAWRWGSVMTFPCKKRAFIIAPQVNQAGKCYDCIRMVVCTKDGKAIKQIDMFKVSSL